MNRVSSFGETPREVIRERAKACADDGWSLDAPGPMFEPDGSQRPGGHRTLNLPLNPDDLLTVLDALRGEVYCAVCEDVVSEPTSKARALRIAILGVDES